MAARNRVVQAPGSGTTGPNPASPGGTFVLGGITNPVGYITTPVFVLVPTNILDYT